MVMLAVEIKGGFFQNRFYCVLGILSGFATWKFGFASLLQQ
jgi:hypothetical protein